MLGDVSDLDVRTAERRWRRDEDDQPALADYVAALRRAGLPVGHDLLDRQVFAARQAVVPAGARASVVLPDGEALQFVGPLRDAPREIELPAHRRWSLSLEPEAATVDALAHAAQQAGATELHLDLGGLARPERFLERLASSPATHVWAHGELGPGGASALAAMPCLTSLRWVQPAPLRADDLAPLASAPSLTQLSLHAAAYAPGATWRLAPLRQLTSLTLTTAIPRHDEATTLSEAADELGWIPCLRALQHLELDSHTWRVGAAFLALLGRLELLADLHLGWPPPPRVPWPASHLELLAHLPLRRLSLPGTSFEAEAASVLARIPLRALDLAGSPWPAQALAHLPERLEELSVVAPRAGQLDWLDRLTRLQDLSLSFRSAEAAEALSRASLQPGLVSLGLDYTLELRRRRPGGPVLLATTLERPLARCSRLRAFRLDGGGALDPSALAPLHGRPIESLALRDTQVEPDALLSLCRAVPLRRLSVDECPLSREAFLALAELPHMQFLRARGCGLTDDELAPTLETSHPVLDWAVLP